MIPDGAQPSGRVKVGWMPAHTAKSSIGHACKGNGEPIQQQDWDGNACADTMAKQGAKLHRVPQHVRWNVELHHRAALRSALRLGVATRAANNHKVPSVDAGGKEVWRLRRDSDGCAKAKAASKLSKASAARLAAAEKSNLADESGADLLQPPPELTAGVPVDAPPSIVQGVLLQPPPELAAGVPVDAPPSKGQGVKRTQRRLFRVRKRRVKAVVKAKPKKGEVKAVVPKLSWAMEQHRASQIKDLIETANHHKASNVATAGPATQPAWQPNTACASSLEPPKQHCRPARDCRPLKVSSRSVLLKDIAKLLSSG